jgi:hypothetical protein
VDPLRAGDCKLEGWQLAAIAAVVLRVSKNPNDDECCIKYKEVRRTTSERDANAKATEGLVGIRQQHTGNIQKGCKAFALRTGDEHTDVPSKAPMGFSLPLQQDGVVRRDL